MSRSREVTWLTTRSPIFSTPREMSSSPATMRSAVVLPQPDGPTRTMNSASVISRSSPFTAVVPSAYVFVTPSNETAATLPPYIRLPGVLQTLTAECNMATGNAVAPSGVRAAMAFHIVQPGDLEWDEYANYPGRHRAALTD